MTPFTWHNYVERRWQGKHLEPKMAELLLLFHLRAGHVLSIEDAILFMWPDPDKEPEYSASLIHKYVMLLRKLYGFDVIKTVNYRGYEMERRV